MPSACLFLGGAQNVYGAQRPGAFRGQHRIVPSYSTSPDAFQLCQMSKHHLASVAVGVAIITILLIIFAQQGGPGTNVGSWFYSLVMVLCGLAFVIFGPLLLCRFLVQAWYRQVVVDDVTRGHSISASRRITRNAEAQTHQANSEAQTQAYSINRGVNYEDVEDPIAYTACVLMFPGRNRDIGQIVDMAGPGLPTYEEVITQHRETAADAHCDSEVAECCTIVGDESTVNIDLDGRDEKSESPPPTYPEAVVMLNHNSNYPQNIAQGEFARENHSTLPSPTETETEGNPIRM